MRCADGSCLRRPFPRGLTQAESLSYYVENPARLQACCPDKYEFIRDRIMSGYRYVSRLREDLTFEVLNLAPDFVYPGRIVRVDIAVEGAPEEDKRVHVEIALHTADGVFDGAQHAFFRLFSEDDTYTDVYLYPKDGNTSVLANTFTLSRFATSGLWAPAQIVLTDAVGNQRFAGTNDFGWRLHVDNPLEDKAAPLYIEGSLTATSVEDVLEGHAVHNFVASWLLLEKNDVDFTYMRVVSDQPGQNTYGMQEYGSVVASDECSGYATPAGVDTAVVCYRATLSTVLTEFQWPGNYSVSEITMQDEALRKASTTFLDQAGHQPPVLVEIEPPNPDRTAPELDVRVGYLNVSAAPTNPEAPNGETLVRIEYFARDDKSGLGHVNYRLLDPQGTSHFEYHYHDNFHTTFFQGDPTAWAPYVITVVLPAGSAPGIWGLESMELEDKVGNTLSQSFVENVHFVAGGARRSLAGGGRRARPPAVQARATFEVLAAR